MPKKKNSIKVLGVRFDAITLKSASDKCIKWANGKTQKYVTTPNPEILLEAEKNPKFKKVLNDSALNIADGTGILWASKYSKITKKSKSNFIKIIKFSYSLFFTIFHNKYIKDPLPERVTGIDLMLEICKKSTKEGIEIFLLGAKKGIAEKTKNKLKSRFKKIKIVGTHCGTPKQKEEKGIIEKIKKSKAKILFVAYGAPKQELWIAKNLAKMKNVKLAIGIGGSFNFIAEEIKRAPKWMQETGLEWAYRLIKQPSRIKRIYTATIVFASKVF